MLRIFDAHVHLFDRAVNTHPFLEHEDPGFKAVAGDYSSLPHHYLTADYLTDSAAYEVEGFVCYEFLSTDPLKETRWAQQQATASVCRQSLVALVDFLDPALKQTLDTYTALPNLVAVRQHLGWDSKNPLRHFAKQPGLLTIAAWQRNLTALRTHGFMCVLELFAPQLPDFAAVVELHPDLNFTLAVLGWPLDLTPAGFEQWRTDLAAVSRCKNVHIEIAGIECIFGMQWSEPQITPWLRTIIDLFGPSRCMFGSHLPIARLGGGLTRLYDAYQHITSPYSAQERDAMFCTNAAQWFTRSTPTH